MGKTLELRSKRIRGKNKEGDHRYLVQHRNLWRVAVNVPVKAQPILKATKLVHLLRTDSLSAARRDRWQHVNRFNSQISAALKQATGTLTTDDEAVLDKAKWEGLPENSDERAATVSAAMLKAINLEKTHGVDVAGRYAGLALGMLLPLRHFESEWMRALDASPKTKQEFRTALVTAEAWLKSKGRDYINSVTDLDVMSFRDSIIKQGRATATVNKTLTALSSYFQFVIQTGTIAHNPWRGKSLEVKKVRDRRRHTMEELAQLFDKADAARRDEMAVALLGMRQGAEWILQVKHVETASGMLTLYVPPMKREKAGRTLPLPDILLPVIRRLVAGKKPDDYLFAAPPQPSPLKSRGAEPGRKFMRWIRRNSFAKDIDWHSFRRTGSWMLEKGQVPESTAARLIGHSSRLGLTYGLYSGTADLPLLKAGTDAAFAVLPESVTRYFV